LSIIEIAIVIENITKISSKTNYACRLNDTKSLAIAKKADRTVYATYGIAAEQNRRLCK